MEHTKDMPDRPAEIILQLIDDKWKVLILRDLLTEAKRFNGLMRSVGGTTQKALTSHLHAMEQGGPLTRTVYSEVPPKMEYTLTETGYSLKSILDSMFAWGSEYKNRIWLQNPGAILKQGSMFTVQTYIRIHRANYRKSR